VGKTTIGAELAALMQVPFFDLDQEVEAFFQTSIGRLQARYRTMNRYRGQACRVLKLLLARSDAQNCVIALPPSGLMVPYLPVVQESHASVVVIADDPIHILSRIAFLDNESRPIERVLSRQEREYYLEDIKRDMRYFARSYSKAHVTVDIHGSCPAEAAQRIKLALAAL
jgi:shikimate kinase